MIFYSVRQQFVRIVVFLPRPHIRAITNWGLCHLLARAAFFKSGAYANRVALRRQNNHKQSFSTPPANPSEILQRCAFHQRDRLHSGIAHELPCFFLPLASLLRRDWCGLVLHGLQCGDRSRQRRTRGCRFRIGERTRSKTCQRSSLHKVATRNHSASLTQVRHYRRSRQACAGSQSTSFRLVLAYTYSIALGEFPHEASMVSPLGLDLPPCGATGMACACPYSHVLRQRLYRCRSPFALGKRHAIRDFPVRCARIWNSGLDRFTDQPTVVPCERFAQEVI